MTKEVIDTYEAKRNRLAGRKIYTYAPMQKDRLFLARVNGWPLDFRGATAMQAHKKAKAFIADELVKLDNIEAARVANSAAKAK